MQRFGVDFITTAAVVLLQLGVVYSENILFLQTTPSRSHHIWNKQLFERLYDNGHNLTILTFEPEESVPGKAFLYVADYYMKILEVLDDSNEGFSEMNPIENIVNMYGFYEKASQVLMKEEAIHSLLNYPKSFKFDLVIHDFTMGQFLLGFVEHFGNPPLISISAFNAPSYTAQLANMPVRFSTLPNYASCFGPWMTLVERAKNILYWTLDYFHRQMRFMQNEDIRARQLFGPTATSVSVVEQTSDIILVNSDFSMDYHQALPPNVIPVGGLHITRAEQIPPSIAEFIGRPWSAIVLLSLGTNVQSEALGEDENRAILRTFAKFPEYGFIWKHGDPDGLGQIPANVLVHSWIPQAAILGSERTKLLVGHGGLLSLQEAVWHGVPVVGIPFFADQYQNVDKLVRAEVGVRLMPAELTESRLERAISTVLLNDSYHANMALRSALFRSQPQPPLDRAIFWIEKVLANKGLPHLRAPSTAHHMPLYQLYGADLALAAISVAAVATSLLSSLLSWVNNKRR